MNCFKLSKSVYIWLCSSSVANFWNASPKSISETGSLITNDNRTPVSLLRNEHDRGDPRSMAGCDESMDTSDKDFSRLAIFTASIEIVEQETHSEGYLGCQMLFISLEIGAIWCFSVTTMELRLLLLRFLFAPWDSVCIFWCVFA